jgi:Zn-dependent protease
MEQQTEEYTPLWRTPEPEPQQYEPQYETPSPIKEDKGLFKRIGGGIVALGVLLAKIGAKLKFLLVVLPKAKLLTTSGTMLVSIAAYAWLFGWPFGIGIVLLILIHELGHGIQIKREGMKAGWPVFIPFLGASISMKEMPKDAAMEARVGLAGPILGSLGTLVPLALYGATHNNLFRALAFFGFFINLFNLVPISPLDGGRAMAALSPYMWLVGFALILVAAVLFPSPIVLLILVLGGYETFKRFRNRNSPEAQEYHNVSRGTRFAVAAVYLSLALALAVGIHFTHFARTFN